MSNPIEKLRNLVADKLNNKDVLEKCTALGPFKIGIYADMFLQGVSTTEVNKGDKLDICRYKDKSINYIILNGRKLEGFGIDEIKPSLNVEINDITG